MLSSLLKTKLYIPTVRSNLVSRQRLLAMLNVNARLTLVSAPAGFGKTTLLADWSRQTTHPVAWLSLDVADNDPTRFWSYVLSALQTIHPGIGQAMLDSLQSPQPPAIDTALVGLVNEIAETDSDWVLVLDDFHVIIEPKINHSLVFLLDHLPPQMHLVLTTRADPPWPLARLRARGEMVELRTQDLRFTLDEASTFLNMVMGLDLSPQDIASLDTRTEGWIAGLQLAAISMQNRNDLSSFVQAFSGSHRFVLDYLVEEVLDRQPDHVRTFLIRTSILDRLNASLCDAVLDLEHLDSQVILSHLEKNNLFLIPLDDERRWYRYHRLFADLLSSRLAQRDPDLVPTLHRRASEWYQARGLTAEAIEHGLQCNDLHYVGQLLAGNALSMMEHGELATLQRLLNAVPAPAVRIHPWLCLAQAWILMFTGQLDAVEPLLQHVETILPDPDIAREPGQMAGHITTIRAGMVQIRGNMPQAIQYAQKALTLLPARDRTIRSWVMVVLGLSLAWEGRLTQAEQVLSKAVELHRAHQTSYTSVLTLCNLAATQMDQGHLVQAADTFREAIELGHAYAGRSGQPLAVTGYAYVYLADILREWHDLDAAQEYIKKGMKLCIQWGEPQLLASSYAQLAKMCFATGDPAGVRDAIGKARAVANEISPWYANRVTIREIELLVASGQVETAAQKMSALAEQTCLDRPIDLYEGMIGLALTRLYIAQGKVDPALKWLSKLITTYESAGSGDGLIRALVLKSIALQMRGQGTQALISLQRALAFAEPEGYVGVFIDQGTPIKTLLKNALTKGIATKYVKKLLAALEKADLAAGHPTAQQPLAQQLADPLSERELEVLRLLPTKLSSTEIAERLYISKNTVRSHVAHIYDKLGVHSRDDAIRRAQALGLL